MGVACSQELGHEVEHRGTFDRGGQQRGHCFGQGQVPASACVHSAEQRIDEGVDDGIAETFGQEHTQGDVVGGDRWGQLLGSQTLGRLGADEGFDLGGVGGHTHDRPFGNRVQTSPTEDL